MSIIDRLNDGVPAGPAVATDRVAGLDDGAAVKAPCVCTTTASITLSGLQTIDGVSVAAGDRVLVKNQSTGSENGIYTASSGAWSRTLDFNGPRDIVQGTLVYVQGGTNGNRFYKLDTASPVIGTSSLSFSTTLDFTTVVTAGKVLGRYAGGSNGAIQELPVAVASDGSVVIDTSSSSAALRVTQTGSGEALRVEDSSNPDATPFSVDASGNVTVSGTLTAGGAINKVTLTAPASSATITPINGTTTTLNGGSLREGIAATRTYYVRTDGSNANTGLSNTAGGAFLTLQYAWDYVCANVDARGSNSIVIQIADGTYTAGISTSSVPLGTVTIQGNSGTPGNVIVSTTNANGFSFNGPTVVTVKDLEVRTTTTGDGISASLGAIVSVQNVRFGACAYSHLAVSYRGYVSASNYTISGNALTHILAQYGAVASISGSNTVSGTPAFSTGFAFAYYNASLVSTATWTGSATGVRYSALGNGVINTGGGGASYFPGNSAGSTASGGQYL